MSSAAALVGKYDCKIAVRASRITRHNLADARWRRVEDSWDNEWTITQSHTQTVYLCTVLGLGHGRQELEYGLGLGHQRGDGMDDSCELRVRSNTWNATDRKHSMYFWTKTAKRADCQPINAISGFWKEQSRVRTRALHFQTPHIYIQWKLFLKTSMSAFQWHRLHNCQRWKFFKPLLKYSTLLMCFENARSFDHWIFHFKNSSAVSATQ